MSKFKKVMILSIPIGIIHFLASFPLLSFFVKLGVSSQPNIIQRIIYVMWFFPMEIMQRISNQFIIYRFMVLFSMVLGSLFWGILGSYLIITVKERKTQKKKI